MKIAICDDEEHWRESLKAFCMEFFADSTEADICLYSSGEKFIKNGVNTDIVLLDIEMGGMGGIQIKEWMEDHGWNTRIIFITSHVEQMLEAFGCNVHGFLIKPVTYKDFYHKMMSLKRKLEEYDRYVDIREPGCNIRLRLKNIMYIEAYGKHTMISAADHLEKIYARKSINVWQKELEGVGFAMPHRSLLVNLAHVLYVHKAVSLDDGQSLKLSRGRKKMFKERFERYVINDSE